MDRIHPALGLYVISFVAVAIANLVYVDGYLDMPSSPVEALIALGLALFIWAAEAAAVTALIGGIILMWENNMVKLFAIGLAIGIVALISNGKGS